MSGPITSSPDTQRRARLAAVLRDHRPADDVEARHLAAMLDLLTRPGDVLSRDHFEPGHFTASAFVTHAGRLLLIHHAKLDRWLQPGGHVDPGDADLDAAARRELHEEAGLTAGAGRLLDVDVHPIPPNPKRGEPAHRHFDVRFHYEADRDDATAGSDALDVRWLPLEEITTQRADESVMRAVRKLLA